MEKGKLSVHCMLNRGSAFCLFPNSLSSGMCRWKSMLLEIMTSFNRIITVHITNYGHAGHTVTSLITILSYPTYICSETQEGLVSLREEHIWFAICRHPAGAILGFELYSISPAIGLDHAKVLSNYKEIIWFIVSKQLKSYISAMLTQLLTWL